MAISERRGVVASKVVTGSVNAAIFASFVDGIDARRGSVAILDNVSFHKTNVVREAAQRKGLSFIFIPPYSPEFNPIEGTFSVLKSALRSGLQENLEAALASVMLTKCQSFFRASRRHADYVASGLESPVGLERGARGARDARGARGARGAVST
jgi:transposase